MSPRGVVHDTASRYRRLTCASPQHAINHRNALIDGNGSRVANRRTRQRSAAPRADLEDGRPLKSGLEDAARRSRAGAVASALQTRHMVISTRPAHPALVSEPDFFAVPPGTATPTARYLADLYAAAAEMTGLCRRPDDHDTAAFPHR